MKVEIKIKDHPGVVAEKVLYTKIIGSFYVIYFNAGKYIYPIHDIVEIKEMFRDEEEKTKVLGEDNIKV